MARTIVGEIFLNVKPLDDGVSAGVQRIIDSASDQAAEVPVDADTEEASQAVAGLSAQIEEDLGGAWITATAQAAAFTAAMIGVRRAAQGALNQLAGIFDQLAQAEAGFSSILGSQNAGQQLLDDIREFARISPFVTQELVNYSQQLLGVGQSAESIVPLLSSVGDVIASVGGDTQNISRVLFTLTQIRSIGRLVGQDAIQLQSSLIPITKLLADFLDVTTEEVKKLQQAGSISADTVFEAIQNAGSKVEGAMQNATRNISGAQSVLSDTVEILLQDSEFLREVFDDIVVGILAFSDALDDPEIQGNIQSISNSFSDLYEGLQPLLQGIGDIAAGSALNALDVLAGTLEVLAAAVNAIPQEALRILGSTLAALAVIRAPLALINYVNTLRTLAREITPTRLVQNVNRTTTAIERNGNAAATAAPKMRVYAQSLSRVATGAAIGATALGAFVSALGQGNSQLETFGSTLQGAGIGATLGSTFGPAGTVVGAFAGGGIAAVSAFVTNAREEAERNTAALRAIGEQSAEEFLEAFALRITGEVDTQREFDIFFEQVTALEDQIADYDEIVALYEETSDRLNAAFNLTSDETQGLDAAEETQFILTLTAQVNFLAEEMNRLAGGAESARGELATLLESGQGADAIDALNAKLLAVNNETEELTTRLNELIENGLAGFRAADGTVFDFIQLFLLATGQEVADTSAEFQALEFVLGLLGTSVEEFATTELDTLVFKLGGEINPAVITLRQEAEGVKKAFDEASTSVGEFFSPFSFQISQAKEATEQATKLAESQAKIIENVGDTAAGFEFAELLVKTVEGLTAANQAITEDTPGAIADGLSFARATFEQLQDDLDATDEEFQQFLASVGLLDLFLSTSDVEGGFSGTIEELAESTNATVDQILELLGISEELADTNPTITVTAETENAIRAVTDFTGTIGGPNLVNAAETAREELLKITEVGGAYRVVAGDIEDATDSIIGSLQRYLDTIGRIQGVLAEGSALGDAFEGILAFGEGSDEFADSIIRTFQNVAQGTLAVVDDEVAALEAGFSVTSAIFQELQEELGFTDEEFQDLLSTMGLIELFNDGFDTESGFFGSIDELIEDTGIADAILRDILGLAESLEGETRIVVTADVEQALSELARLENIALGPGEPEVLDRIAEIREFIRQTTEEGAGVRIAESNVLEEAQEAARREAERLEREQERAAQERERQEAEAQRAAEQALRDQERVADALESAGETLESAMEAAAANIESAANAWTASLQERVQPDAAAPISRLLRNATAQVESLAFINEGLQTLEGRGLTPDAISALGIDNVSDERQVRRLLSASPSDLTELSRLIGLRDTNAETIARRQQREETKQVIVDAILTAAAILGTDLTREQAIALSGQFTLEGLGADQIGEIPPGFLEQLLNTAEILR